MIFWLIILFVALFAFVMGIMAKNSKKETEPVKKEETFVNEDALKMKLPKTLEKELDGEDVKIKVKFITDRTLAYARHPQVEEAEKLKYSDPEKALDMLLPICDEEKGIYVKHICLQCYRQLKDPVSEKKMIFRIFDKIETIKADECNEIEYDYISKCRPVYEDRLRWVETLIERKRKKEEKLAAKNKGK